jgi:hypothetical protein
VSAAAFEVNLRRKENTFFITSIYELDRELEARRIEAFERTTPKPDDSMLQRPNETELQWLERILPGELKEYADVFSKKASNVLAPHRPYDHKIRIDDLCGPEALGYSPLRNQSTLELQETKQFLEENLQRGFIVPSQAPFASPVLFAKKPNGAL